MLQSALLAWLHYVGFAGMLACLVLEHRLFQPTMSANQLKALGRIDLLYGGLAGAQIATGVFRLWLEKGVAYYLHNGLFHAKLMLFVMVGLASLYPTIHFIRLNRGAQGETVMVPQDLVRKIMMVIRLELFLMLLIPLFATMMARGMGIGAH
ncbi:putative membrane protein [Chitinivorax tropicus]|uniref:Putative membrane protein n=1 Tax=Chitinivorax tropicus TaxID=714531 RepID=A0A840MQZ8_9PROT|nr:DUF2214 family protein [Chitinivorax tropicus]MBB5018866.1 putative membrane protein [Chitinivorax tropicus]